MKRLALLAGVVVLALSLFVAYAALFVGGPLADATAGAKFCALLACALGVALLIEVTTGERGS